MEIITSDVSSNNPVLLVVAVVLITALCCVLGTLFTVRSKAKFSDSCGCSCKRSRGTSHTTAYLNGVTASLPNHSRSEEGEMVEKVSAAVPPEKQTGASMMEQLVPEITTHALSYLDYPSLCRLSMTNSLMRKAANDDNAWKALYHKDFTLEQDSLSPVDGWKAYYASTRAIMNINSEFVRIINERVLADMGSFWLNADYVKCFRAGEFCSGYNDVMQSWHQAFTWEQGVFQVQDVRVRVLRDSAWVTMKAYVDMEARSFNMTNIFEFHNGRWYMVHHHTSVRMVNGGAEPQMMQG